MRAAIGGIYDLTGRRPSREEISGLAARSRIPVRHDQWIANLGHGGLFSQKVGIRRSEAPWSRDAGSGCLAVVDGSLDHRSELVAELFEAGTREDNLSSEDLVAAAYERWGDGFAGQLVGAFAALVVDPLRRRAVAVSDALGLRHLFYKREEDRTVFASQARQLVHDEAVSLDQLDPEYLADYFASQPPAGTRTPFKGVQRLPAGHALVIEDGRHRTFRYWDFEPSRVSEPTGGDWVAGFRELFADAVRTSVRSDERVWAELSGGLDSSSIVCMAQRLLRDEPDLVPAFETLTMVWSETEQCDERKWSNAVVESCNVDNHHIDGDKFRPLEGVFEAAPYWSEPHFGIVNASGFRREAEVLAEAGATALLSGGAAEAVVLPELAEPRHLADLLRKLRLRKLGRELRAWQQAEHRPYVNMISDHAVKPLLTHWFRRQRSLLSRRTAATPWVTPKFQRRMNLEDRALRRLPPRRFDSVARQFQYEKLQTSGAALNRGYIEWSCEVRHPFLYRPLAEFALAAPWKVKIRPGEDKALLRDSMKDILPEIVRTRRGKRGPGAAVYRALARRWPMIDGLIESSLLAEMEIIDANSFREFANRARHGTCQDLPRLLSTLSLEIWLQAQTQAYSASVAA